MIARLSEPIREPLSPCGRGAGVRGVLRLVAALLICAAVVGLPLVSSTGALAAEAAAPGNPYAPIGTPPHPRVTVQWDRYHDSREVTAILKALVAAHPQRAKLTSLGRSYGGREMWVLTLTNFAAGDDRDKPAFWIDGGIHANEVQGTEAVLYTAWYLLELYGQTPFVTQLLDRRTFYCLPMMSPDSRDAHMHRPASTHTPRSGQRPRDDDRDGRVDEDRPDDLDGDGHITQMRIRDPHGRWISHPDYPELMIPAPPDQRGAFRLLGAEGYDNDGDGRVDEDADGSYDPNRNWAWDWQPEYVQPGAHLYPFSLPEIRLVADFLIDHPNVAGAQSYHNMGGMILRGPGAKEGAAYEPDDVSVFDALARRGELVLPGYKYLAIGKDLYPVAGGELDWLYNARGVFGFTNEMFTAWNYFRKDEEKSIFGKSETLHAFNKHLLFGQGLVPWHAVDHPQFGRIEVGGLKKNWGRQPPAFLLEEECHRNMAFTLYHADQMPQVEVDAVDVQRQLGGLVQVTATIANRRMLPTHAAIDLKHRLSPPDQVSVEGPGLKPLVALWSDEPFFQAAKEQKSHPQRVSIPAIRGMQAVYVRWLVDGDGPYTITVRSAKGGSHQMKKAG